MALEEVSFINLIGEEVNISNIVNQMVNFYKLKRNIGETKLTDFNEGSEIRNILEAYSVLVYAILEDETEASKLPFINYSYGGYLDRIGENPFINLPRETGEVSIGTATFTLNSIQSSDIIIPAQTLLEDNVNGLEFITDEDIIIEAGETSADGTCSCLTEGADGNINADTLTVISDVNIDTDLISVNNQEAFINGVDYEDDEDYRTRLLENVQSDGFGTIGYYKSLAEKVDGVHDVKFINNENYTKEILINGFIKNTPDIVLLDVLTAFSDVENIVLGHNFTVNTPEYVVVDLTFNLNVLSNFNNTDLENILNCIVNGGSWGRMDFKGLFIGEQLTKQFLVDNLSFFDDILNVEISITGESSEFDTTNINLNQVVKLGNLTFNQTIVG